MGFPPRKERPNPSVEQEFITAGGQILGGERNPPDGAIRLRTMRGTKSGPDGEQVPFELTGTPETIETLQMLIEQVQTLQQLLDARDVETPQERQPWEPFQKATKFRHPLAVGPQSIDSNEAEIWINNHYQVTQYAPKSGPLGPMIHLSLRRQDRKAVHDWRDLQRIKNELVGPEAEAVEIFPAESRLVDGANQYHLWVFPEFKFPFGFNSRLVSESTQGGVAQRLWRDDERPDDLQDVSREQMLDAIQKMGWDG